MDPRATLDGALKWISGTAVSGAATQAPHFVALPRPLATSIVVLGGIGVFISALIPIVVSLTKLVEALETLFTRTKRFRNKLKASRRGRAAAHRRRPLLHADSSSESALSSGSAILVASRRELPPVGGPGEHPPA
jgi:hypothetical protein